VVVYVVSSTGDGDAPDNCDRFFVKMKRAVKKDPKTCAQGCQYTVLGGACQMLLATS
jgi:NADPH-ferrihemoprotein reductase